MPRGSDASILMIDLARRYGGAEARVVAVARAVSQQRPVTVVCLEGSPLHRVVAQAGLDACTVQHGRGDPRTISRIRDRIAWSPETVVDAHNVQSQLWSMFAARKFPEATLVASVHSQYRQEHEGRRRARWYEFVLTLLNRYGAGFIAVSDSVGQYLEDLGVDRNRIAVVWNAVEVPDTAGVDREAVRRSLGLSTEDFAVVTVARLTHIKGHHVLIDALRTVADELPQLRWLVVGDGPAQEELQQRAARSGLDESIRWLGFRDDVPALLRASDCIALPSLSEGLPLALLEAAGQQVPILATSVGAVPDVFQHARTARIVPPGDPGALAAELRWLVAHPRERSELGTAAAAAVADRLDAASMVRGTLAAYDGFFARSGPPTRR